MLEWCQVVMLEWCRVTVKCSNGVESQLSARMVSSRRVLEWCFIVLDVDSARSYKEIEIPCS